MGVIPQEPCTWGLLLGSIMFMLLDPRIPGIRRALPPQCWGHGASTLLSSSCGCWGLNVASQACTARAVLHQPPPTPK